jgi:hypothetical protein
MLCQFLISTAFSNIFLFLGLDQFVRFFGGFFTSAPSMSAVFLFKPTAALGGALALVAFIEATVIQ